ncbi:penicillin-binding protein [Candidatus Nomurabacteria bacterium]|nr:penicillin-binding protein [Candidatus Nomurabacteria bacterium]
MNFWRRILRGIDLWIEKQLDKNDTVNPRTRDWHPPHTIIHDVRVRETRKKKQERDEEPVFDDEMVDESPQSAHPNPNMHRDIDGDGIIDGVRDTLESGIASLGQHWSKVKNYTSSMVKKKTKLSRKKLLLWLFGGVVIFFLLMVGILLLYVAFLKIPTFDEFIDREIASSTKIYDQTGEILLFDVHEGVSRTVVPLEEISPDIINALIAIEDDQFYQHHGIDVKATFRAILYTGLSKIGLRKGGTQGGSTLTQQVLKNTLLTSERTFKRKMKEWFLAVRLERMLTKDEILENYLNESPYGGSMYGVETAAQAFFGKHASEVTIAEAAYLAAIPNAPTYYSPYGNHEDRLENRKNTVLRRMRQFDFITEAQYQEALAEKVEFRPREEGFAKAIHFVEYVRQELVKQYGEDMVDNGGLRVITTLNYDLQKKAEEVVAKHALLNEEQYSGSNMALVSIDPATGGILAMVGSRGYSDPDIDGKFNVATAYRQPGSSFKPFIYATALAMGYTDKTILFDVQTQFTSHCTANQPSNGDCYRPNNHDQKFLGPMTMRNALAQSRNIPAVKMLYLVGIQNALNTAKVMGITGLKNASYYGLTLVLGGGEVRLVDMTSAYGVFANDGVRVPHTPILEVYNQEGEQIYQYRPAGERVIDEQAARTISDILADDDARAPLFGYSSALNFGGQYDVAGKTGTTNDKRDGWLIGYSPSIATGIWTGNNDNTPMTKGSTVAAPAWDEYMTYALTRVPNRRFIPPTPVDESGLKPILRGVWQGNETLVVDTVSGKLATELTPPETRAEIIMPDAHNILHWVNPSNPRGPAPNPPSDRQYNNWEAGVQSWLVTHPIDLGGLGVDQLVVLLGALNTQEEGSGLPYDDVHTPENQPIITSISITPSNPDRFDEITIIPSFTSTYPMASFEYYLDDLYIGTSESAPFSFMPEQTEAYSSGRQNYTIKVVAKDTVYSSTEASQTLTIES